MKTALHPKWNPKTPVSVNGKVVMTVGSTQEEIDVDVWSGNHPFYTGGLTTEKTGGRIERFKKQAEESGKKDARSKAQKRADKKAKRSEEAYEGVTSLAELRKEAKKAQNRPKADKGKASKQSK